MVVAATAATANTCKPASQGQYTGVELKKPCVSRQQSQLSLPQGIQLLEWSLLIWTLLGVEHPRVDVAVAVSGQQHVCLHIRLITWHVQVGDPAIEPYDMGSSHPSADAIS